MKQALFTINYNYEIEHYHTLVFHDFNRLFFR